MTKLSAGDWVEVKSREEILATLDSRGQLDHLPFMPEMFQFCGGRFQVWSRAHKTCDTVSKTGGRWMPDTVHLKELRCDGQAHGGCGAGCLIFWKEAWLRPLDPQRTAAGPGSAAQGGCATEQDVWSGTREPGDADDPTYICQTTAIPQATSLARWWDIRQYLEDYTSGNVELRQLLGSAAYFAFHALVRRTRRYQPRAAESLIQLYDRYQARVGGVPYPRKFGTIPAGQRTPSEPLHLQPGELVRVKTHLRVLDTLDTNNRNRGMYFDAEEVPFCGHTYRVRSRVDKLIVEQTGKLRDLKDNNVILEGVYCKAYYSEKRVFCPRALYSIWRETWLERVPDEAAPLELKAEG